MPNFSIFAFKPHRFKNLRGLKCEISGLRHYKSMSQPRSIFTFAHFYSILQHKSPNEALQITKSPPKQITTIHD